VVDVVSAAALDVVDGIDPKVIKVTRSDGSVCFVPPVEGNRDFEELSAAVAARTLTVTGASRVGLRVADVTAREQRRAAELADRDQRIRDAAAPELEAVEG
jgi:hypothetical protein